jgi:hypothetical protein
MLNGKVGRMLVRPHVMRRTAGLSPVLQGCWFFAENGWMLLLATLSPQVDSELLTLLVEVAALQAQCLCRVGDVVMLAM